MFAAFLLLLRIITGGSLCRKQIEKGAATIIFRANDYINVGIVSLALRNGHSFADTGY